jgi:ATP synthase protein I
MNKGKKFTPAGKNAGSTLFLAGTIGLHLVSGVIVGALIGYGLDKWLDSSPWGMAVFVVIGIIAGFRNVYLDAKRLLALEGAEKKSVPEDPPKD